MEDLEMSAQEHDALSESNEQYIEMWRSFARRFPGAALEELPGLTVALSGTTFAFLNLIAVSSPVRDAADLAERCRLAIERGKQSGVPFVFAVCESWTGDPEAAREILASAGLKPLLANTGMATDTLLPPRRPFPTGLEIRRVNDEVTRNAISDLNCMSYGVPLELGRATVAQEGFWDDSYFGYVGFVDGEAVSCTMTAPVDGRLYVSWVATHPERRQKGYGEAVMRRSLEEAAAATGLKRTVLHATQMGFPVYEAMGYRTVAPFNWYSL
jgi:GNAT superfamily N-acetyltransferase